MTRDRQGGPLLTGLIAALSRAWVSDKDCQVHPTGNYSCIGLKWQIIRKGRSKVHDCLKDRDSYHTFEAWKSQRVIAW